MMSASVLGCKSSSFRSRACRPGSTRRSVSGISAGPSGPSAKRSTMPKGAAANLASGGMGPVSIFSGKLPALASGRPLASFRSAGRLRLSAARSGKGPSKRRRSSSSSPAPSSAPCGANSVLSERSRTAPSSLRATGALNVSSIGRIGMHAAWAFSRSQRVLAVKGSRTL